jgi:diguanylate cyclase (GGDEF)-like protein
LAKQAKDLERFLEQRTQDLREANIELSRMAATDPLTGALNRRSFYRYFNEVHAKTTPAQANSHVLVILDIDHFKQINDRSGHDAGDQVLKEFTRRLLVFSDLVFRLGGEEFALVKQASGDLQSLCAQVLKAIASEGMVIDGDLLAVTASAGAIHYRGDQLAQLEAAIKRVDQLLYQAKAQGRNCAVIADAASGMETCKLIRPEITATAPSIAE